MQRRTFFDNEVTKRKPQEMSADLQFECNHNITHALSGSLTSPRASLLIISACFVASLNKSSTFSRHLAEVSI